MTGTWQAPALAAALAVLLGFAGGLWAASSETIWTSEQVEGLASSATFILGMEVGRCEERHAEDEAARLECIREATCHYGGADLCRDMKGVEA